VKVLDVLETPVAISLILEYVAGESLSTRLKRSAMAPRDAASMAMTLARVIGFVHQHGLLHRDIKPGNILIRPDGEIKIADFGLVKEEGTRDGLTQAGDFIGTPNYVAPEQVDSPIDQVDVKTDVYSIGATLYEMISGRPPFVGVSTNDTLNQVKNREPLSLRVLNPATPRDLETICLKCLEKHPERRYSNAFELADELDRYLKGEPIRSRPVSGIERCYRWCRRNQARAASLFMGCVAAIGMLLLLVSNNRNLNSYNQTLNRLNRDLETTVDELDFATKNARKLQHVAEVHEQQAKDWLYASNINRAAIALQQDDTRELSRLLEQTRPNEGDLDRRGFEWWFLDRQANRAGKTLLETNHSQYVLRFVPGTTELVCAGDDSTLRFFDSFSGELHREIATKQLEVNGIAFSPDGLEVATGGDDGTIAIWNRQNGQERLRFKAHPEKTFQVVYTADGSGLICCGTDSVIRAYNAADGTLIDTLQGHQKTVESIELSVGGNTLISASDDHSIKIWDLKDRTMIHSFETAGDAIGFVNNPKNESLIVGDSAGQIRVIGMSTNETIDVAKHLDRIGGIALHPDGELLAAGDLSGQITIRRIRSEGTFDESDMHRWQAHKGLVQSLVWTADGTRLVSTANDGQVISWNLATIKTPGIREVSLEHVYAGFSIIPHSTSLAVSEFGKIRKFDWRQGDLKTFETDGGLIKPTFSPDGSIYAGIMILNTVPRSDKVLIFETDPLTSFANWPLPVANWDPREGELNRICFSPDSKTMAVSKWYRPQEGEEADHVIYLLDLTGVQDKTKQQPHAVQAIESVKRIPVPFARAAQFSPDGKRLAIIARYGLVVWDLNTERIKWETLSPSIYNAAFSSDGTMLAMVCSDRLVRVLNAEDGTIRFQSTNHRAPIHGIAFSPDNRLLATGSEEGTIKFWHLRLGQELMELKHQNEDVLQLEFTSNSHLVAHLRNRLDERTTRLLFLDGSATAP
jgi:WD40 repeat protein/serine/threonine protein kinase